MNNPYDPGSKYEQLLRLPVENEIVEFKKAETGKYFYEIGKYFAALSTEANFGSVANA